MTDKAISTAQMLGGLRVLGVKFESDRDLKKIVSAGLPTAIVTQLVIRLYPEQISKYRALVVFPMTFYMQLTVHPSLKGSLLSKGGRFAYGGFKATIICYRRQTIS